MGAQAKHSSSSASFHDRSFLHLPQMSLTGKLDALPEPHCSQYNLVGVLGGGAFALVYLISEKETRQQFALKVIEKEPFRVRLMLGQLIREVAIATETSSCHHIAQLLEASESDTHVFLRFALCESDLSILSSQRGPMTEREALLWLRQACLGVKELHARDVIHRDLKPNNLLMDAQGNLRICDFGYACNVADQLSGIAGTPGYSSPECSPQTSSTDLIHSKKVDIYSLGACLQHLLLGRVPQGVADLPLDASATTLDLLHKMMRNDPDERPSIDEVLQSHVLQEVLFLSWFTQCHIVLQDISAKLTSKDLSAARAHTKGCAAREILTIAFAGA